MDLRALSGQGTRVASIIMAYDESFLVDEPQTRLHPPTKTPRDTLSPLNKTPWRRPRQSSAISLLSLPTEILDQILRYLLPYTFQCPRGIAWHRASRASDITVAPLRTCRLLHRLGSAILYGENTFLLHACYTGTEWKQIWGLPDPQRLQPAKPGSVYPVSANAVHPFRGVELRYTMAPETAEPRYSKERNCRLYPSTVFAFPDKLAGYRLEMIQKWSIVIALENEYTGKIKYGWGGAGLLDGVLQRVRELCGTLKACRSISVLEILLDLDVQPGEGGMPLDLQSQLSNPFQKLNNLREGGLKVKCRYRKGELRNCRQTIDI